ncbi:helix-turn-helix domain-containing protein [Bifidobacterium dentium]|uniref:helix-turn-helix domain-containing protein n=1 Tax=Bifidobacterium dentium TaxID=1689 RepID=UPI0009BB53DD|nr:helix-turn-helix domain-containing protein [Bifidobacterium dentium]OQM55102.1 zinc finger protein [Bifidobacterium dentium]
MSNIALSWAFKCHVGNASAKAVLVYLADRADDDGTAAYPKIATIVNVTELSERTVRAALKTLQERGFIRRGDQRYARLGKGGRNRLPQYCQVVWDLAVEADPSTLEWIRETHTAERDPMTMSGTVDPAASTIMENGESKDVTPENVGTKPVSSTANPAGLENEPKPAVQIPQGQHCKSRTSGSANVAGPALQISQGCIYKDKTLHVNPPCKPNPSLPTGELPASGKRPAEKDGNDMAGTDSEAATVMEHLTSVRSRLMLTTAEPTRRDRAKIGNLVGRIAKAHDDDHAAAVALILAAIDWLPSNTYWLGRIDSARRLADNWDQIANDWTISQIERRRALDSEARDRDRKTKPVRATRVPSRYEERHVHTFVCEHVLADMRPHEDEYDHEGSLRYGHPSEWQTACMEHADELNQRDGIEVAA